MPPPPLDGLLVGSHPQLALRTTKRTPLTKCARGPPGPLPTWTRPQEQVQHPFRVAAARFMSREALMTHASLRMTEHELRTLPAVVDVPTPRAVLGVGRTAAYELIRAGGWPTPTLRLGKLIRIPTAPLLELVGVSR